MYPIPPTFLISSNIAQLTGVAVGGTVGRALHRDRQTPILKNNIIIDQSSLLNGAATSIKG